MIADTSRAAYDACDTEKWRDRVLFWLQSKDGFGCLWEACIDLDKPKNSLSGRFTELKKSGLIIDSGMRMKDPDTGVNCTVWQIVEEPEEQGDLF